MMFIVVSSLLFGCVIELLLMKKTFNMLNLIENTAIGRAK